MCSLAARDPAAACRRLNQQKAVPLDGKEGEGEIAYGVYCVMSIAWCFSPFVQIQRSGEDRLNIVDGFTYRRKNPFPEILSGLID